MTLAAGTVLGSYRISRFLGDGGMGCVYEAEHVGLKVRRALKVFSTESDHGDFLRKRFLAEGRILADLQHPRIVRVYDFAVDEATGTPYFAMDLVVSPTGEPQTLEQACRDGVDEEQVAGWFRDICEGLGYIHGKGIVHRDVSLDNILIDPEGRAVLTDFGIAKITGEGYRRKIDVTVTMVLSGEKLRMGKGLYMAPELKSGAPATIASDAYAVGVIVFRLLAGAWYTPHARLEDTLAGLECYDWSACLKGLLAEDPAQRASLVDAVAALALVRKQDSPGRRVSLVTVLVVFVLAMAVGGGIFFVRKSSADPVASAHHRPNEELESSLWNCARWTVDYETDSEARRDFIEKELNGHGEIAIPAIALFLADKDENVRSEAVSTIVEILNSIENDPDFARRIVKKVFDFLGTLDELVPAVKIAIDIYYGIIDGDVAQMVESATARLYERNSNQTFTTLEAAEEWCDKQEKEPDSSEEEPSDVSD